MRQLPTNVDFEQLWEGIGLKINSHLTTLDRSKKGDKQKILELCQIGKLIFSYFSDFEIVKVSERPDFLISNGTIEVGLEHQLIVDSKAKSKEGFYENLFDKVESNLSNDATVPNFLANLILKDDADLTINNKSHIVNQMTDIIKEFVLTGVLRENEYIRSAHKMRHSGKTLNANFGGHLVKSINHELILEFLEKKEDKIESYIKNSGLRQWLVLVIGGLGESSYEVDKEFGVEIQTRFDKVFLYEDFQNRLFEIK